MPMEPITWSTSKVDTAVSCLYKYNKVYNEKIKEASHALSLGSTFHEVMANEIISKNEDPKLLLATLDSQGEDDPELYSWVPSISSFVKKWNKLLAENNLESTVEKKYAVDRDFKSVDFFSKDAYIRGVFDLWTYDEKNKRLIIVDHKSSKKASSPAQVREHNQLLLYVVMLSNMFNLEWKQAYVALHFVRHAKLVHAWLTHREVDTFLKRYTKLLNVLEERIIECYETGVWERTQGFHCRWCSFKGECPMQ